MASFVLDDVMARKMTYDLIQPLRLSGHLKLQQ